MAVMQVLVGEPDASGSCGGTRGFQSGRSLAQRYTIPADGTAIEVLALQAHLDDTTAATLRGALYDDVDGEPGALLAATADTPTPGVTGWFEVPLPGPLAVTSGQVLWIAWQTTDGVNSCSPSTVANSGRRYDNVDFGSAAPDPFDVDSAYNNTRGMRMLLEGDFAPSVARASLVTTEALVAGTTVARVSHIVAQVLAGTPSAPVRTSQVVLQVLARYTPPPPLPRAIVPSLISM